MSGARAIATATLLSCALLVAGCGGGGDDETGDDQVGAESTGGDENGSTDDAGLASEVITEDVGFNNCVAITVAYEQLSGMFIGGSTTSLGRVTAELRGRLPNALQDDLAVVLTTFDAARSGPVLDRTALSTPEFETADQKLQAYVDSECAPSGGG